jgi:predicted transcriptional regulator
MVREKIIKIGTRKDIYDFISKCPGLHLNELSRKTNIPKTTMYYHLNYLKKRGILTTRNEGRYVRYYIANKLGEEDKKIINLLRQDVPYKIIMLLYLNPNSTQVEISKHLKKHPTTISFHLDKLINLNIIEGIPIGNEIHYCVMNQDYISDLLIKYGEIFLDYDVK